MSSGIDCGKLEEVLESIFQIPVDAARLDKWVNGGEFETVVLGGREVPTLRNLIRQIDERESQAAEEEINEAKAEIGALAEKIQAKIDELKAMTASAETLPSDHPATVYYNASTGEFEFGIPQGKQGIQGERGLAPAIDILYAGDPSDEALTIVYGGDPALTEQNDKTIIRQVGRIGTSAQWATVNPVLENGELGYERTAENKVLWKIGDGVTPWNDIPYPSIFVDKVYRFKGSVDTFEDLPQDAQEGDVYNVNDSGANYAWTGETWDNLGVVQEIDSAPIKDSGNPVSSGGVYLALEAQKAETDAINATVAEHEQDINSLQSDIAELQSEFPIPIYQGANEDSPGIQGLVPPAEAGQQEYYLGGDGNWHPFTSGTLPSGMPVGSIYIQFTGQAAPSDLFGGTWSNVSSSYAGLFFRAEGGAAAAFGGTQSDGAPNVVGWFSLGVNQSTQFAIDNAVFQNLGYINAAASSIDRDARIIQMSLARGNNKFGAAAEVRPVNSTIRIWKRTA